jgi:hypothetical protein
MILDHKEIKRKEKKRHYLAVGWFSTGTGMVITIQIRDSNVVRDARESTSPIE